MCNFREKEMQRNYNRNYVTYLSKFYSDSKTQVGCIPTTCMFLNGSDLRGCGGERKTLDHTGPFPLFS